MHHPGGKYLQRVWGYPEVDRQIALTRSPSPFFPLDGFPRKMEPGKAWEGHKSPGGSTSEAPSWPVRRGVAPCSRKSPGQRHALRHLRPATPARRPTTD